ncbi:hypothetical protein D3C80_1669900 [compost metagenome]
MDGIRRLLRLIHTVVNNPAEGVDDMHRFPARARQPGKRFMKGGRALLHQFLTLTHNALIYHYFISFISSWTAILAPCMTIGTPPPG